jgi:hypothetical protein
MHAHLTMVLCAWKSAVNRCPFAADGNTKAEKHHILFVRVRNAARDGMNVVQKEETIWLWPIRKLFNGSETKKDWQSSWAGKH